MEASQPLTIIYPTNQIGNICLKVLSISNLNVDKIDIILAIDM